MCNQLSGFPEWLALADALVLFSNQIAISCESGRAVKNRSTAVSCRRNRINNWMAEEETRGLVTKLNMPLPLSI